MVAGLVDRLQRARAISVFFAPKEQCQKTAHALASAFQSHGTDVRSVKGKEPLLAERLDDAFTLPAPELGLAPSDREIFHPDPRHHSDEWSYLERSWEEFRDHLVEATTDSPSKSVDIHITHACSFLLVRQLAFGIREIDDRRKGRHLPYGEVIVLPPGWRDRGAVYQRDGSVAEAPLPADLIDLSKN